MTNPFSSYSARKESSGFTLLELLVGFVVVAILAALLYPTLQDALRKPEGIRCMNNLRSLHVSFSSYVTDHQEWPQLPEGTTEPGKQAAFWLNSVRDYGAPLNVWQCPGAMREIGEGTIKSNEIPPLHYMPTQFTGGQFAPYKWAGQPWLAEIYDHGDGPFFIFPDGSIKTFNTLFEAATGRRPQN